jgi:integrase
MSAKGEPLRPRTRAEYNRQLNKGLAVFRSDQLGKITSARVRAWHAARLEEAGATAAAREAALLRAIMNTAVDDGIIEKNPVNSKLTRSSSGVAHRMPTPDELAVIVAAFEALAPRLRLTVLLAAFGGLRLSEWRALRRRDITINDGRVTVTITRQAQRLSGHGWIVGPPKSAEGVRVIPLPAALTSDVQDHLAAHVGPFADALLFAPGGRGEFLGDSEFNAAWNAAREAAGVRVKEGEGWTSVVREHDLRHFALSFYAASGATLAELKARAGHASARAALAYQHVVLDRAAELADAMPALPVAPKRMAQIGSYNARR